ncbi:MAG: ribosome-associated translation inhibitor RaiA [Myxococcales bacterium]|nr:ribosome-associated translation inhibitor RaiA [Myxococcales bacterium]
MNISITFRHMDSSDAIKEYSRNKIAKLQKFLRQPMRAKVTLSVDKRKHVAEMQISSGGEHLEAKEATDDMYASIDKMIDKLERQIRGHKGAAQAKKRRSGATLRGGDSPEPVEEAAAAEVEAVAPAKKKVAKKKVAKKKVAKKAPAAGGKAKVARKT